MAGEVTTTVGYTPIPFGKAPGYGRFGSTSRGGVFAGSSEMVGLCTEALARLQVAIDVANEKCSKAWFGAGSICAAAAQMQIDHDYYEGIVQDPNTPDEKLGEILVFINKNADISDLLALAKAGSASHIIGDAIIQAPGTAVHLLAEGAEEVAKPVLAAIPWWAWAFGALYVANMFGLLPKPKGR